MDSKTVNNSAFHEKCVLFLASALLVVHISYGWKYLQPSPIASQPPSCAMPDKPQFFDWENLELFSAPQVEAGDEKVNPFLVSFVFPAPPEPVKTTEEDKVPPPPPPPPPPPKRVLTITYKGTYGSLTGKTYVLMDITDSATGKTESVHIGKDRDLPEGIRIAEVTENFVDLVAPDGMTVRVDFSKQADITIPNK